MAAAQLAVLVAGVSSMGVPGLHPQVLASLSQLGGQIIPPTSLTTGSPGFSDLPTALFWRPALLIAKPISLTTGNRDQLIKEIGNV